MQMWECYIPSKATSVNSLSSSCSLAHIVLMNATPPIPYVMVSSTYLNSVRLGVEAYLQTQPMSSTTDISLVDVLLSTDDINTLPKLDHVYSDPFDCSKMSTSWQDFSNARYDGGWKFNELGVSNCVRLGNLWTSSLNSYDNDMWSGRDVTSMPCALFLNSWMSYSPSTVLNGTGFELFHCELSVDDVTGISNIEDTLDIVVNHVLSPYGDMSSNTLLPGTFVGEDVTTTVNNIVGGSLTDVYPLYELLVTDSITNNCSLEEPSPSYFPFIYLDTNSLTSSTIGEEVELQ